MNPKERSPERATHLIVKQEVENNFSSLDKLEEHFIHLYGRRNDVYLPGRTIRIELFHRGVSDLVDSTRKESDRKTIENMFARIVSRIFCIAHGINNISVAEGMRRKYPFEGCSYCHSLPCQCGERRPSADLGWGVKASQSEWSLREWQNHLRKLYGERNKERGLDYIFNRLSSEVGELISLEHDVPSKTMDEIELEYQLELADSLAWTVAAANFLDVDLQEATINRYGNGCRVCKMNPCNCGAHSFKQVRFW
jgi:NTP pyrophosphatase (non-canonical NTP hydrolase)